MCETKHPRVVQLSKAVRPPAPNLTMPKTEMDRQPSVVSDNEHSQYMWTTEEDDVRAEFGSYTDAPTAAELDQVQEIKQEIDDDMSLHGTFFWGCYRSITVRHCMCTFNKTLCNI